MQVPASYKTLNRKFSAQPEHIQGFFDSFPALIKDFGYEVAIAYCFFRLEQAYNRTLYGGARKLHKVNPEVLSGVLNHQHLTRQGFLKFYEVIFGKPVSSPTQDKIKFAEKIRDRIIHGKSVADPEARRCLSDILDFAVELEIEIRALASFTPFGDMRGITGQATSLDKATTRWVLKGMGFGE